MAFTYGVGPANANGGSGTTVAATLTGTTAGRHLIVLIGWENGTQTLSSVTCSGESDLTILTSSTANGGGRIAIAYLANNVNGGDKTVTATFSGSVTGKAISVNEFYGGDTTSLLDAQTTATGSTANPSLSLTTTTDNALIVSAVTAPSGSPTAGTDYTLISGTSLWGIAWKCEYDLDASTAGSKTVNFVNASATSWTMAAAAFKLVDNTREGTLTKTEASDTLAATGTVAVNGALSKTEAADTISAEGIEGSFVEGNAAITEAADTFTSSGNVPVVGTLTKTEGGDGLDAEATVANTAVGSGTLPRLTLSASSGNGVDATLPLLTLSAVGLAGEAGALASILPVLSLAGVGTGENTGTLALSLPALTLFAGDGGGLIEALPALTLEATSVVGTVAILESALPLLTLEASGTFTNLGTLTATLSSLEGYGTGVHGVTSEAAIVLPALRIEASGESGELGTAAITLPSLTLSAAGYLAGTATALLVLPSLLISASGAPTLPATYRTWVVNLKTRAVTEYTGFTFNSYANFDGRVLAASISGIFELNSATADNTTDIDGVLRTGKHAYETSYLKRVPRLYLSYSAPSGDLEVRTITSEDGRRRYLLRHNGITGVQQRRVPVGKGPKSKYWQFELANRSGSDFDLAGFIVYPQVLGVRAQ